MRAATMGANLARRLRQFTREFFVGVGSDDSERFPEDLASKALAGLAISPSFLPLPLKNSKIAPPISICQREIKAV
jgi:hypothetical protein